MKNFAELKKNRKQSFENVATKSKEVMKGGFEEDDRLWKPTTDKAGNAQAIIRFMPAPPNEDNPWSMTWSHFFKGPGGWYVEKSLTTLGDDDPVSEYNSQLWNSGVESNKEIARRQKRRRDYYANVYIVKDPGNPEMEGQVKIYRFGTTVFNKINDMMNPQFEGDDRVNPFDLWEGANFKLRIYKADGFPKYDKCEFMSAGPLFDDDDKKLEATWKQCHPLKPFSADGFKSYDELKKRLDRVLGLSGSIMAKPQPADESKYEEAAAPREDGPPWKEGVQTSSIESDDDEKEQEFFNSLRN